MGGDILVLAALLALIPAFIARHKNRSFGAFYVFGFLLWIVAIVWVLVMKDERRHCPYCVEPIAEDASVCPHCRSDLAAPSAAALRASVP